MDCMQAQKNIYLYIDGLLAREDAADLIAHLEICPDCRDFMMKAKAFDAFLHENMAMVEPPVDFSARVMAALPAEEKTAKIIPFTKRFSWASKLGSLVAALALVVGIALANPFAGVVQIAGTEPGESSDPSVNVGNAEGAQPSVSSPDDTAVTDPQESEKNQEVDTTVQKPAVQVAATEPTDPEQPTEVEPVTQEPSQPTESGDISLPKAAYGAVGVGRFEMRLIAAHEGLDVLSPLANEKTKIINYYIQIDGKTQLWQVNFSENVEPAFVAAFDSMEDAKANMVEEDSLKQASTMISQEGASAFSPDGSMLAAIVNGDEEPGLWLAGISNSQEPWRMFEKQCGSVLSWAPNSGKLVFTDSQGCLYVAYPAENMVFPIATGTVSQVIWVDRGNTIIFLMCPEGSQNYGLYVAQLP